MAEEKEEPKEEVRLTKQELQTLVQILNQPRQQDLQVAQVLIILSNKLSLMIDKTS